jgi:protein-S-isoprenylcysteine O-methyltransferase Ste14
MKKKLIFLYGILAYFAFSFVFLYAIGFFNNLIVPKSIDTGASSPFWQALWIDAGLICLFAIQHSVMARPGFKRVWTRIVPKAIERSTYVLLASLVFALLYWQWRPLPERIWDIEAAWGQLLMWGLYGLGWAVVIVSTFMISHTHLFGLKQVYDHLRGQKLSSPAFKTTGFYHYIRQPMNLGLLIAFWATPHMTVGHLVFSVAATGYILVALRLEERDLIQVFGDKYRNYQKKVPMLIPRIRPVGPSLADFEKEKRRTAH